MDDSGIIFTEKIKIEDMNLNEPQNQQLNIGAVSGRTSSDKIIFFYDAFNANREISAHIFNDVFSEFEERFYNGKSYKNAMLNFKKYMKMAAENRGHKIIVSRVNKYETVVHGVKNVWSVLYVR
jgi:hypothetical protein